MNEAATKTPSGMSTKPSARLASQKGMTGISRSVMT